MFLLSQDKIIYNLKDIYKIQAEHYCENRNGILLFTDKHGSLIHNDEHVYSIYICDDESLLEDVYKKIIYCISSNTTLIDVPQISEDIIRDRERNPVGKSAKDYLDEYFIPFIEEQINRNKIQE
ncbi:MAG: hypothetical protein K2N51_16930 [Lachnospiraceae bacterium]|nr:hypothetical protein [Lachnospiraceae bacterium]